MLALPAIDRDKLVKVLGMTGSDHLGEVVAAVTAARRILTAHGLEWRDVIVSPQTASQRQRSRPAENGTTAQDTIAWCLDHGTLITDWERRFLVSLQRFPRLSAKQRAVLDQITQKCGDIRR